MCHPGGTHLCHDDEWQVEEERDRVVVQHLRPRRHLHVGHDVLHVQHLERQHENVENTPEQAARCKRPAFDCHVAVRPAADRDQRGPRLRRRQLLVQPDVVADAGEPANWGGQHAGGGLATGSRCATAG